MFQHIPPMRDGESCSQQIFMAPAGRRHNANIARRYPIEHASWVWHPQLAPGEGAFLRFTLSFNSDGTPLRLHLSADRRFNFFVDDQRLGGGPVCGDPVAWPFHSYELSLTPGEHQLCAEVWWLPGSQAPEHLMSLQGGFICAAEGAAHTAVSTGLAPWKVQKVPGWRIGPGLTHGVHSIGGSMERDLRVQSEPPVAVKTFENWWDNLYGIVNDRWQLEPVNIPDPREVSVQAGRIAARCEKCLSAADVLSSSELLAAADKRSRLPEADSPLHIPANTETSLVLDLEDYYCGVPEITLSGGKDARVEYLWAESLVGPGYCKTPDHEKGHRGELAGKCFYGFGDAWILAGTKNLVLPSPHWWRAGRYALLRIKTAGESLILHSLRIRTTGYPWPTRSPRLEAGDPELGNIFRICWRAFAASTHDSFMDCPYYEQLMYAADTRVMMLVSYALAGDDRLARRAMELFDLSRRHHGLSAMRYPCQRQMVGPTFSLWWIGMVHDFAQWRRDRQWVTARLHGIRATLSELEQYRNDAGLLENLPGWPFVDWVDSWSDPAAPESNNGVPANARRGISAVINCQYLLALNQAAALENYAGLPEFSGIFARQAAATRAACRQFLDSATGLLRDAASAADHSEHAQALALLAGVVTENEAPALLDALAQPSLPVRASTYFLHHVFDALAQFGRAEAILARLAPWSEMLALGLCTSPEKSDPTRSDCHGWGSHPLFHFVAGVIGLRPADWEFRRFILRPALGALPWAEAVVPHPDGEIRVRLEPQSHENLRVVLSVPPPLTGQIISKTQTIEVSAGTHEFLI